MKKRQLNVRKGLTLVEIIFALGIFSLLSVGIYHFVIQSSKSLIDSENKISVALQGQKMSGQFKVDVQEASYAILYDEFNGSFRDLSESSAEGVERLQEANSYHMDQGEAGNFLLLVYNGVDNDPNDNVPAPVERMVGYYLDPEPSGELHPDARALRRFEGPATSGGSDLMVGDAIEDAIPEDTEDDDFSYRIIAPWAEAIESSGIFYKFRERVVSLNARLIAGDDRKIYGTTFSVTVAANGS